MNHFIETKTSYTTKREPKKNWNHQKLRRNMRDSKKNLWDQYVRMIEAMKLVIGSDGDVDVCNSKLLIRKRTKRLYATRLCVVFWIAVRFAWNTPLTQYRTTILLVSVLPLLNLTFALSPFLHFLYLGIFVISVESPSTFNWMRCVNVCVC